MTAPELNRFASLLVRLVRDRAIEVCDRLLSGSVRGAIGERWRQVAELPDSREAIAKLIPDMVDEVLFELLNAIDNGDLPLAWQSIDGSWIALQELGQWEMAGWFVGSDGWRDSFSEQRFYNPFSDLQPEHGETDGG